MPRRRLDYAVYEGVRKRGEAKLLYNLATARQYAQEGRIDEWIQDYLNTPAWANPALAAIIQHQKPFWIGPIEVELSQLVRCCGPEEHLRYPQLLAEWEESIAAIATGLEDPAALPPLLVRPVHGVFGIPDGNHRQEAMRRKGWHTGWVLLWCDRDPSFHGSWASSDKQEEGQSQGGE